MSDPELMLLDEPAAGLDLGGREDLVARLGALAADVEAPALVLVTHHVEEIPPSFTDVLLLREGRIVAAGPIEITLTAANLSTTFGLPLVVERHGQRWSARAVRIEDEVGSQSPAPVRHSTDQRVPASSTVLVH
jgi:iron complex transport system ATP-binding protein